MTAATAAKRYARALFDVLLKEGVDVEKVQAELQSFADLFATPELAYVLESPGIAPAKKLGLAKALIDRAGSVTGPLAKLILVLAEKDRMSLLPGISRSYADRVMDHLKIVRGDVTTAMALPADKLAALEQGLAKATGRKVVLKARVDASIIGGAVTRLGSTVYDGSVTTQLQKMKQSLIEAGQ